MKQRYENIGALPLVFTDRRDGKKVYQEVEVGETFERDFAASDHPEQEQFLILVGGIRQVNLVVPSKPGIQAAVAKAAAPKQE
jgi:hypothetical protein